MKQRLVFLFKYYIYWVFLFLFSKILFVIYQYQLTKTVSFGALFSAVFKGLVMDVSVGGYLIMIVSLALSFTILLKGICYSKYIKNFNRFILIIVFLIIVGDMELYRNWGFHVDTTPLFYLKSPKEAFASVSVWLIIILLLSISILVFVFDFLYVRYIQVSLNKIKSGGWYLSLVCIIVSAFMIIPIRGGLKLAPLNPGALYFHENIYVNHVAINPIWNLMYSLKKMDDLQKDYKVIDRNTLSQITDSLYSEGKTFKKLLNKTRPNVVIILLESFSAKTIEVLGGIKGITPNLNKYSKEGIFFENIYACGNRSDKGIPAVLSAYPSNPVNSILRYPAKSERLPCLANDFNKLGYSTSFYYGGDINFANIRQYVTTGGFNKIIDDTNFDSKYNNSKWGVHDHVMFRKFYDDMQAEKTPFFKVVFTLSSHEPFDIPIKPLLEGSGEGIKYLNSINYTDKCLGDFIEKCKSSKLWDNTLFVLVADHGVRLPNNDLVSNPSCFKIPMLWIGGAIDSHLKISTYGNQMDLARTLLCQLNADNKEYKFSRNLLSEKVKSFSFYTYNDGVAFINDSICSIFDNTSGKYINNSDSLELRGRALLQLFYSDFKGR